MTKPTSTPWCPNVKHASHKLKPDAEPGFWCCPVCGDRHDAGLVSARPKAYRKPVAHVPAGYDPVTGAEAQDYPR